MTRNGSSHRGRYEATPSIQNPIRYGGTSLDDQRATLTEFLPGQRPALQLKCEGLDAAHVACRSVEPSTMSPLGLARQRRRSSATRSDKRFRAQNLPNRSQSRDQSYGALRWRGRRSSRG
jgi:hypothetical protein